MNRTAILLVLSCVATTAFAAEAPKPAACVSPPSVDYVPGIDATGRAIAPADLNGQTQLDLKTITVVPRVAVPNNPVVKDAQIVIDLQKAGRAANCAPVPVPRPNP